MKKFLLRPATTRNVSDLFLLIKELAEFEKMSDEVTSTESDLFRELFELKNAEAVIGEFDGCTVGFAIFFQNYSTFTGRPGLHLEDLYVKPEFRGRGFGKDLLCYLAKLSLARGYPRFEWSVLKWNQNATNFYDKQGAVPMTDWVVYRLSGEALNTFARDVPV